MNANKIKEIQAKAKAEKRNLTDAEVTEIKRLEAEKETASSKRKAEAKSRKQKALKIVFTKSPTGEFKLAYSVGDKVKLPIALATELIEAKYAELTK